MTTELLWQAYNKATSTMWASVSLTLVLVAFGLIMATADHYILSFVCGTLAIPSFIWCSVCVQQQKKTKKVFHDYILSDRID